MLNNLKKQNKTKKKASMGLSRASRRTRRNKRNKELKQRRFLASHVNRKWCVFLYQIGIAISL